MKGLRPQACKRLRVTAVTLSGQKAAHQRCKTLVPASMVTHIQGWENKKHLAQRTMETLLKVTADRHYFDPWRGRWCSSKPPTKHSKISHRKQSSPSQSVLLYSHCQQDVHWRRDLGKRLSKNPPLPTAISWKQNANKISRITLYAGCSLPIKTQN